MSLAKTIRNRFTRANHESRCVTKIIIRQNIEGDRRAIFFHHEFNKLTIMIIRCQRGIVTNTLNRDPEAFFVKQKNWLYGRCRWSTLIRGADAYVKVAVAVRSQLDQHRRLCRLVNRRTGKIGIDITNNGEWQIDINGLNGIIRGDIDNRYRVGEQIIRGVAVTNNILIGKRSAQRKRDITRIFIHCVPRDAVTAGDINGRVID